jgi:membrane protease YdiL (CAAX protease family)
MKQSTIMGLGIAASIVAWQASPELPALARGLTAILVGVFPAFSVVQAQAVSELEVLPGRNKLYASTIVGLWGLAFATAFVATESRMDPRLLGVAQLPWTTFFLWLAFALIGVAALILAFKAFGVGETRMIHHMIPQSRTEKLVYVGVSATAGICEELVFRGFLIAALTAATGSVPLAVIISAGTFGVAHAHQDAAGALRATLLAFVLTVPLLATGSLYPGIAAHALVDLVAGLWLSKWLLKS